MIINSIVIFNVGLTGFSEIRKLTANVEAILLGVIIPLCQRNSGRLEEADREVWMDKVEFPYSCMLRCVRPSCGTLFSCFSYFHAFTGAHEIPVFVIVFSSPCLLVIFSRLYGFLSWKLSWPLNESVKTQPAHILLVRKMSLIVFVILLYTRGNCVIREDFAIVLYRISTLGDWLKILRHILVACVFPRFKTAT